MITSKLCLGTVQFGIPYGVNNSVGMPTEDEINSIFKVARQSGINYLDTASAYGDSEKKIGKLSDQNFKIISKFAAVKNAEELDKELSTTLNDLQAKSIYGYMAHNANSLISNPGLWKALQKIKENKLVEKIGYSLYNCEQLEKLLALNFVPDIVQLPYSLLDKKFEVYLPKLKELGTEIHVRSVFLQGLYFMDPSNLPVKLQPLKPQLEILKEYCIKFNVSIGALALNYVTSNPYIDKVVIGVDNTFQLLQNTGTIESWKHDQQLLDCINHIDVTDKELLNPANW